MVGAQEAMTEISCAHGNCVIGGVLVGLATSTARKSACAILETVIVADYVMS